MIGRLKPGVSRDRLQAKLSGLLRNALATTDNYSSEEGKKSLARAHVVLTPGGGGIRQCSEEYGSHLRLLMWASGLVLLIACANIANLLLARGMGRKAEMSCGRLWEPALRIVRQLLTESLLLAGIGGIAGLVVAYAGTQMLLALAFPGAQGLPIHASPSPAVVGFAFALSLLTGVLFGVAPAFIAAQAEPVEALRSGTRVDRRSDAAATRIGRGAGDSLADTSGRRGTFCAKSLQTSAQRPEA